MTGAENVVTSINDAARVCAELQSGRASAGIRVASRYATLAPQLLTLDDLSANFSVRICRGVDINVPLDSRHFGGLIVGECGRPFKGALGFRDCNGHVTILAR